MERSELSVATGSSEVETIKDVASYVESEYDTFTSILTAYLSSGKTLSHLVDLMYADVDGKVITLPCKLGETVYVVKNGICDHRNRDACNSYCDGWDDSCEDYVGNVYIKHLPFVVDHLYHMGTRVFLTEEEAIKKKEELEKKCRHIS